MLMYRCILTLFALIATAKCAKILGVFHVPGPSHYMAGFTLMKILADKGHDVTMLSAFKAKKLPKNMKEIVMDGLYEELFEGKEKFNMFEAKMNPVIAPIIFTFITASMQDKAFNHTKFKEMMNSGEKYDVVIMEQFAAEAMKYVAHHFNAPLIVYNPMDANDWVNAYQGNPDSPAYTPSNYLAQPNGKMSFFERTVGALHYVYINLLRTQLSIPYQNRMLHRYYPDAPHIDDFSYNVSLVLLNSDPSIHEAAPRVPSMVNIGGFHIVEPKPIPADLQQLLDNAKNGVVYFSMGSSLKSKDIPEAKRDMILRVLSKLKETVIWKFEDENLPGKPANVIIKKWLPQNDMFVHKNIKLFITHGGIFSSMEAIYHGLPILALPVLSEQVSNARRAEAFGYAKVIPFIDLTEEQFSSYLQELLGNPKYKENVVRRSNIMKDKPYSQKDAVNYWVEHVVRHKGAAHLRVASLDLAWYQYMLLDVALFVTVSFGLFVWFMVFAVRTLLKTFRKKEEKQKVN